MITFFNDSELCKWLWSKPLQGELQNFVTFQNSAKMHKDKSKPGPSGMLRNQAYSLPGKWGGRDCLIPINVQVIWELKQTLGGDAILEFTSAEFSEKAKDAYDNLGLNELTFMNVWFVFDTMKGRLLVNI